jgi:toxin ParE1/3/4
LKPVVFSPLAEADLEAIADFIAKDNPSRALTFVEELRSRCEKIGRSPEAARAFPALAPNARIVPHRRYVILFRNFPGEISIERILHGARDIASIVENTPKKERTSK